MFTEETIGRVDAREPALSTLDAEFAAHATAIEELYRSILTGIAEAARAWTPETARLEVPVAPLAEAIPAPRPPSRSERRIEAARTEALTAPRTEAIPAQRTDAITEAITVQQPEMPVRTRGAHHAETGQLAAITARPAVPRTLAA